MQSTELESCGLPEVLPKKERLVKMSESVYQIVTEKIIEKLESGVVPWRKPWRTESPCNLVSQREYSGLNRILLASDGYSSKFWLTLNQANKLGGRIKKGERSSIVTFWKKNLYTKKNQETGDDETRQGFLLRYFRVFNLSQTEGIAENLGLGESAQPVPNIGVCDAIVKGMPNRPDIIGSDRAWYSPVSDQVGMPARENFLGSEEYYSTFFHELIHSTGHRSRLHREQFDNPVRFGSESYSKEELIAELGASMLCGVSGIAPRTLDNSASYLKSWISRLRGDSRLIISAASAAPKASDFILGKSQNLAEAELQS
jgi:antirestriction protein ArdC